MERHELERAHRLVSKHLTKADENYLIQSIEEQKLYVCKMSTVVEVYTASTSRFGVGIREGSFKTPPGIHRICEKIGDGLPAGRVLRERRDTGIDWNGLSTDENLILTRILRLEGLEPGVNQGAGLDSYDRCIYIHGTNQEERIGTPESHGCIVLRNVDMIRLFKTVPHGAIVYVQPLPFVVGGVRCRSVHFTGIFGTGMSALAQYLRFNAIEVSGSDRLLDSPDTADLRRALKDLGCTIVPQDGKGVREDTDVVCVSTAIEESNAEILAARRYHVPIVHRSDVLASIIASKKTIAVAGTSGKSTVTAMIFEFLTACGKSPSLICGAPVRRLENRNCIGNAYSGASDLLVVEADESDGTIVKYGPEMTVVLNISKDHRDVEEISNLFKVLLSQSKWTLTNVDDPLLAELPADCTFGEKNPASWHPDREELLPDSVKLFRDGFEYHLPCPGAHNLENLRATLCICEHLGCGGPAIAEAVRRFQGVARRFTILQTHRKVWVVDDFAHNPAKIAAAVRAARGLSSRILAVYQPHGFGPTRFLREEYVSTFRTVFRQGDVLVLLPIYYAGGTAVKDISSADIIKDLGVVPFLAQSAVDRGYLLTLLKEQAAAGDCILLMGARDPSLPGLAGRICEVFGGQLPTTGTGSA